MTAKELAAKMRARARAVEPEFSKTTRGLGVIAVNFTRERMDEEIYSQPIPRSAKGRPLWKRTKNLRKGERYEVLDPYSVRIVNDMSYAEPRHEAGKPGRRPTRYPAHWRDELQAAFRSILLDAYHLTVRDILKRGGG